MRKRKLLFMVPLAILGILLFVTIGGVLVMQLWNWLLPPLFGLRVITFWQAFGILVLCRILFGGLGRHGAMHSRFRHRMGGHCGNLSDEERERFRQRMREVFVGATPPQSEGKAL